MNVTLLKAQLSVFKLKLSGEFQSFHEIYSAFQSLYQCKKDLISEIVTVFKLILVNPATNAVSETSFSTARRLKTWLRSSMNQIRFNNLATLMIHSDRTANIDLDKVASEFASGNDNRKRHFVDFIVHLACIYTRVSMNNFHMHGGAIPGLPKASPACQADTTSLSTKICPPPPPPHFIIPSAGPAIIHCSPLHTFQLLT